jgi:hypothetical protein
VACLQPGVVQALAVLVHADILPLCSEDGSGTPHYALCAYTLDGPASPDDIRQAVCMLLWQRARNILLCCLAYVSNAVRVAAPSSHPS